MSVVTITIFSDDIFIFRLLYSGHKRILPLSGNTYSIFTKLTDYQITNICNGLSKVLVLI